MTRQRKHPRDYGVGAILGFIALGVLVPSLIAQEDQGKNNESAETETAKIINIDDLKPPVDQLMKEAVGLQESGEPARAAAILADALRYYPETQFKEEIVFRLAECYRSLGRYKESREMVALLHSEFKGGEWSHAGHLLAGEMDATEEKWKSARGHFRQAAKSSQSVIQVRSLYFSIISSIRLDQLESARAELDRLVKIEKENPHRDFAFLKLGELVAVEKKQNSAKRAEELFQKTLSITQSPDLRAEAAVRVGNLVYSQKRYPDAIAYYEMVRKLDAPKVWRELSHLGLVQSYFARKQYGEVIRIFNEVKPNFPADLRASVFFMVGESYRLEGKDKEALRTYDLILRDFKKSPLAKASLWARVMILQRANDSKVAEEAAKYMSQFPDAPEVPRAKLIRADSFFKKRILKTAGPMYEELLKTPKVLKDISVATYRQALLRAGICAYGVKDYPKAVKYLDDFLKTEGKKSEKSQAIWLLGQAQLAQQNLKESIGPFRILIEEYPKFKEREELLWKLVFIYGNLQDYDAMKQSLQILLKEFNNDGRKAELYFWLAVSSQELDQKKEAFEYWGKARLLNAKSYFERATRFRINYALTNKQIDVLADEVARYDEWQKKQKNSPPLSIEIYEWLAQEYEAVGKSEPAEMNYRKVLALNPPAGQEKRTRLKLSRLMSKDKRHGAAVREWEIFRKKYPADADRTEVLSPLAKAYLGSAEYEKAQALAEQILRQNPEGNNNALGRILLGDVQMARLNYDEAAKLFRAVALIAMDDEYTPLALSKAEEAFRRGGNEEEADKMFLK
ncbi:MAG: tetratricopeptide repeat protein, partial [Verrucomicrobiota bacterium]